MKKLLLFAGLPAVGKSTLSREIGEKLEAKIVDLDDFKKTDVDSVLVKSQIDPPDLRWSYYQKAMEYAFHLYDQGASILILDEVFHLESLRSRLEMLCVQEGVSVFWIEVQCSYGLIKKRLESNARKGHILSTEESLRMHLMLQNVFEDFPTGIQNHIVINNDGSCDFEVLVDLVLQKVC